LKDNKFGIAFDEAERVYLKAAKMPHLNVEGIDCHIGSQLLTLTPFMDALDRLLVMIERLKTQGVNIHHIDLGGGLGVRYNEENPPLPSDYTARLMQDERIKNYEILMEPGRAIIANAGVLVTEVEYLKLSDYKNFAVIDAAMNDLIRPALYQSWMKIIPVMENPERETRTYDVVGPVCETSDFLGKGRDLAIQAGDLLVVRTAGAYGFTMASNYNTRTRAAEIMVDGHKTYVIRERETLPELYANEKVLPL
jgi:diaminopimelate decarboxylase